MAKSSNKATRFPSEQWFRGLVALMSEQQAAYRDLGSTDCTMVVKVTAGPDSGKGTGEQIFEIVFEGYSAVGVRQLASTEAANASHFVLEASLETWREMIDNIRDNGGPDLEHTLNYLTFPDDPMLVTGPDQLEVDAFYRYNESLQRFFNAAAELPTSYA